MYMILVLGTGVMIILATVVFYLRKKSTILKTRLEYEVDNV